MTTYIKIYFKLVAKHLNLEFEMQFHFWFFMEFSQDIHDRHGPGIGCLEHTTFGTRLHHLGHEGNHILHLLLRQTEESTNLKKVH